MAFLIAAQHGFLRSRVAPALEMSDVSEKDKKGVLDNFCYGSLDGLSKEDGYSEVERRLARFTRAREEKWRALVRQREADGKITAYAFCDIRELNARLLSKSGISRETVSDFILEGALLLFHNHGGFSLDTVDLKSDGISGQLTKSNKLLDITFQVYFFERSAFYSVTEVLVDMSCMHYLRKCADYPTTDPWNFDVLPEQTHKYDWCKEFQSKAGYYLISNNEYRSESDDENETGVDSSQTT